MAQHDKGSRAVSLTGSNPSLEKKSSLPRNEHRPSIGPNSVLPLSVGVPEHKQNGKRQNCQILYSLSIIFNSTLKSSGVGTTRLSH